MTSYQPGRPDASEFAEFYARYIDSVSETDIVTAMQTQRLELVARWRTIEPAATTIIHPPYQWTLRQVVGHLSDGERVFGYRALRFSRGDESELPGFDENLYVRNADFDHCPWADLVAEFDALRHANCLLFRHLDAEAWHRSGIASGQRVSVRALAYIIVGHVRHHGRIIESRLAGAHPVAVAR